MENDAIQLKDVTRVFGTGDRAVTALDRVCLDFPRGTFTAVMGPSGSGAAGRAPHSDDEVVTTGRARPGARIDTGHGSVTGGGPPPAT